MELISNRTQHRIQNKLHTISIWIHKHPSSMKVLQLSTLAFSLYPSAAFLLGRKIKATQIIFRGLLGLASYVTFYALNILCPPHHEMKTHVFKPGQCEGGKLYYEGDVPILKLNCDKPYIAGKAHGYLCGEAINQLCKRFDFVLHSIRKSPRADQLKPEFFSEFKSKIPQRYLDEMEGLLEGYNQWSKENRWKFPMKITFNDILLFHLMPDSLHFDTSHFRKLEVPKDKGVKSTPVLGCTSLVDKDEADGFVFARNMDWPSLGLAGAYSIVIEREFSETYHNTIEVGNPGFIGTLTGMNAKGLCLSMNVCDGDTKEIGGVPACIYNRICLEESSTVYDIEKYVASGIFPLGAYHLTVADSSDALSMHFYQSNSGLSAHAISRWEKSKPLSILNYCYDPKPDESCNLHMSKQRQEEIDRFLTKKEPLEKALELPYVNNWLTTHRVVMKPQSSTFQVAFDNAFAGSAPLQTVSTKDLFSGKK